MHCLNKKSTVILIPIAQYIKWIFFSLVVFKILYFTSGGKQFDYDDYNVP